MFHNVTVIAFHICIVINRAHLIGFRAIPREKVLMAKDWPTKSTPVIPVFHQRIQDVGFIMMAKFSEP